MGEKHSSDKADKVAMEKRRRRMLERADKLEAQARELMAEAEKARAHYANLTKAGEQGDDSDESDDGTDKAVSARLGAPSAIKATGDEVVGHVEEEHEAASKKKHGKEKKEKKSKRSKPESTEGALADAKDEKEKKKRHHSDDNEAAEAETGTQDKKATKKEKKRKREAETEAGEDEQEADDAPTRKSKKEKKENKSKKEEAAAPEKEERDDAVAPEKDGASGTQGAEQWSVGELGGGASRQNKFFRLLGGKKGMAGSGSSETAGGAPRGKANLSQMADDLQRQFDTGMRMKFDAGGQRRGLGA